MNKTTILALIDAILNERINSGDFQGKRGPRGLKGLDGQGFEFIEHKTEILELLRKAVAENKALFNLTDEEKEELKLSFDDFTDEQKEILRGERGPRGQRGKAGKDFEFEEHQGNIHDLIIGSIDDRIEDLKLKFSYLTDEEKDSLRFKFSDLSDHEKEELRGERGPRGQKGIAGKDGSDGNDGEKGDQGEKGERGPRGQRGKVGEAGQSAYELWLEENDGDVKEFLQSLIGEKGDRGQRGAIGPQGLPGIHGRDGRDGQDAPQIIDIQVEQRKSDFSLVFIFSDGSEIETEEIKIPSVSSLYQSIISSGGSGLQAIPVSQDGVPVGDAEILNFVGMNVEVDGTNPNQLNIQDIDYITVQEEGVTVSSVVTTVDFVGENVTVVPDSIIADWTTMDEVDIIATYGGDENVVHVVVDSVAERLSKKFIAGEAIGIDKFVRLGVAQEAFLANNNTTYEGAQAVGVSLNGGLVGEEIDVLLFGVLESGAFSFTINNPFFLGTNGNAIQNPPTGSGEFIVELGQSLGVGSNFLDIARPQEIL